MRLRARIPVGGDMELEIETREHLHAKTGFEELRGILSEIDDPGARKMLAALPDKR